MSVIAPTLKTARLALRPWAISDADDVSRICGDKEIAAATASLPHPYTMEHARQWLQDRVGGKAEGSGRSVALAACETDGGRLIGAFGLRVQDDHQRAELGYWVAREAWGNGYATEAARAVVGHGFQALGLRRICADYYKRNAASGRVLEKLGFTVEGCLRRHVMRFGRVEDLVVTGMLREDWESRRSKS